MNISLALSGGGVKGFAHIGSLRVLEDKGYRILPKLGPMGIINRVDILEVIKSGEQAARETLDEIRRVVSCKYRLQHKISRLISP